MASPTMISEEYARELEDAVWSFHRYLQRHQKFKIEGEDEVSTHCGSTEQSSPESHTSLSSVQDSDCPKVISTAHAHALEEAVWALSRHLDGPRSRHQESTDELPSTLPSTTKPSNELQAEGRQACLMVASTAMLVS